MHPGSIALVAQLDLDQPIAVVSQCIPLSGLPLELGLQVCRFRTSDSHSVGGQQHLLVRQFGLHRDKLELSELLRSRTAR
jgi:hypothetical protein